MSPRKGVLVLLLVVLLVCGSWLLVVRTGLFDKVCAGEARYLIKDCYWWPDPQRSGER